MTKRVALYLQDSHDLRDGLDYVKYAEEKGFDPGEFIFDHIVDHYNWHILTTGSGKHISIHLPVIIYDKETGFHVFSSKRLDHGHVHDGFKNTVHGDGSPCRYFRIFRISLNFSTALYAINIGLSNRCIDQVG